MLDEVATKLDNYSCFIDVLFSLQVFYDALLEVMIEEEVVLATHAENICSPRCPRAVLQCRVDQSNDIADFGAHSSLSAKLHIFEIVIDEPLEHRDVKVVLCGEFKLSDLGSQLFLVTNKDQLLNVRIK